MQAPFLILLSAWWNAETVKSRAYASSMSFASFAACLIALGLLPTTILGARAPAATVLMISIDGLKPEYVIEADQRRLKIPNLRGLMAEGAYADGVARV